ncbi:ATP-binding protein [Runella salmonicolor]|uniref:ATP-binding protein n=1 Tax=Runella salmonicolor TaxID=2950278 RepID=A0ABT1FPN7_9BACT|nr:ATP-binding protein [Runella salmonicolor]MCP1383681.1 ATP-binding protein [Runella salmonicolor]
MEESFNPTIGKTVLETLTSGMYDDARFIFREYIQNAVDQIDQAVQLGILSSKSDGKVEIEIDVEQKRIVISDNATGVSQKDALQFLGDVANSQKDSTKQRGFRGIGRLGGLGYCDRLIFETSYKDEAVRSKMVLDAKLLKRIIEDSKDTSDAAAAISIITSVDKTVEDADKHYFRVILEDVNVGSKVLDINKVQQYLSMVAPVPFSSSFSYANEIKNHLQTRNLIVDEYNIVLNNVTLFKAYKDKFNDENEDASNIIGVDFVDITNDSQELLAICWYGYRNNSNVVIPESNIERGIRIRTKNIALGDESTCKRFFDAERTNLRFIGEIHTVNEGFVPNARRDYFNENSTCQQFEENAKKIFTAQNLENRLAQTASKLYNRLQEIKAYQIEREKFMTKKGSFGNEATEKFHLNKLKEMEKKAVKAIDVIKKIEKKSQDITPVKNLYQNIIGNNDTTVQPLDSQEAQVSQYDPPTFTKLNTEQEKVVLEIFDIMEDVLDFNTSEMIKKRIVQKYN